MASRFPPAWLDTLRERNDIVQVVSSYVSLKKNGKNYWGLCPFHGEKTASFSVNGEKQFYYCFGCKAGGSVINFIMEIEHLSFHEAVEFLADRAHMPLPEMIQDDDYERRKTQRDRLREANKAAARFYHETLFKPEGAQALAYLKGRGLSDSVIRKFGLGAAPNSWDTLTLKLLQEGFTQEELVQAGLTVVKEAEPATEDRPARPRRMRDMFRNRAMFPIIDQYGNVLAFGGRILEKGEPKYLNTSDTPIFNKRNGVFAANLLRKERHLDRVILTEGYMDVISLTQFGVRGVCATLGTALTNEQARLLHRFAPMVYLSYDGDSAGQHAILRGLDILKEEGIPARVLDFPDGLDPDEFIRRDGPEGFQRLSAITPETYRIRRLRDNLDLSAEEGKITYAREVIKIISDLDPIEREGHIKDLMVQTGFSREVLQTQLNLNLSAEQKEAAAEAVAAIHARPRQSRVSAPVLEKSATVKAEEVLLGLCATGLLPEDLVILEDFKDPELKLIYQELAAGASVSSVIEQAQDEALRSRLASILQSPSAQGTDEMIKMARDCLKTIRTASGRARQDQIMAEIAQCRDPARKLQLLAEYQELEAKKTSKKE